MNIFVYGLSFKARRENLIELFAPFGEVTSARIITGSGRDLKLTTLLNTLIISLPLLIDIYFFVRIVKVIEKKMD